MSLDTSNDVKHKLDDDGTPLPKRSRLIEEVVNSQYMHMTNTTCVGRIIAFMMDTLMNNNKLTNKDGKMLLTWLEKTDQITIEMKMEMIKVLSQYLQNNFSQNEDNSAI